jgi:hypothetical protein
LSLGDFEQVLMGSSQTRATGTADGEMVLASVDKLLTLVSEKPNPDLYDLIRG